jgi:hypothetical protein
MEGYEDLGSAFVPDDLNFVAAGFIVSELYRVAMWHRAE